MTESLPGDTPPLFGAQLMPALHRHPEEAARIGRIIAAFGEIEFMLALCVGEALSDRDTALRAIFRMLSDRSRIDMADALGRPGYEKIGLRKEFDETIEMIRQYRIIRNQYAHRHYADQYNAPGLYLTNLTDAAESSDAFEYQWRHVDLPLLDLQEAYFLHAIQRLQFLEWDYQFRTGKTKSGHGLPWPTRQAPPPKHNPPSQHVPHWLPEEGKRRHVELALEWEYANRLRQRSRKPPREPRLSARGRRDAAMARAEKPPEKGK